MEQVIPERENTCVVLLSSLYLAPVEYYAALFQANRAVIEVHDTYQKQSYRNRTLIGGANGTLTLSIPIVKPTGGNTRVKDIRISEHGNWRHLHWNALVSAYNSTPYFQYFEDDFRPFYEKPYRFLHDFNEELRVLICRLLELETPVSYTSAYVAAPSMEYTDLRETIHPKRPSRFTSPPYYQVFQDRFGFHPNLSIVDLLFNMGNESRIILAQSTL